MKQANLYDRETLLYTQDLELKSLPSIGAATVKQIRKEFGVSIFAMSARRQAETFNIPYEEIYSSRNKDGWIVTESARTKKPELVAKNHYLSQGFSCENGENFTVRLLMEALMYPLLVGHNVPLGFSYDDVTVEQVELNDGLGVLEISCPTLSVFNTDLFDLIKNESAQVIRTISTSEESDLRNGLRAVFRHDELAGTPLSDEHLVGIWRLLGKKTIHELAIVYVSNAGYSGWPDLTLIKDDQVHFVEIKTSDNLQLSQIDWWRNVGMPLRLNFEIARLKECQ